MRPIRLDLQGLHSYRDRVEVDFDVLGTFGLFGIFGATGAGKSSLLDGMTLALFGQIDRHPGRSRRGVLNPHCERIEVGFTFALSGASEGGTYEVRRVYRADKSGGVVSYKASLSRIEGGPDGEAGEVLVEQEGRVTDKVEALLGLTALDFTRAVVLPQGKFMAFLHLKGKERRTMLQRILRLEAYGDGLRKQVKLRLDAVLTEREGLEGQRIGLGAASPEDIAAAEVLAAETRQARRAAELVLGVAEKRHAGARQIRELQERRDTLSRALGEHLAESDAIDALSVRLSAADRAAEVTGPGERWEVAQVVSAAASEKAGALEAEAARCKAAVEAARTSLQTLRDQQAAAEGERLGRREALKFAAELSARRTSLEAELAPLTLGLAEREDRVLALTTSRATRTAALAGLAKRRELLDVEYRACVLPEAARAALSAAAEALTALEAAEKETSRSEESYTLLHKKREKAREELKTAKVRAETARAELALAEAAQAAEEVNPARVDQDALLEKGRALKPAEAAAATVAEAAGAVARLTKELAAAREREKPLVDTLRARERGQQAARDAARAAARAVEAAREQALLAAVAARLTFGDPCPVCGGADHPAPASGADLPEADEAALDQARGAAEAAGREAAAARARWESQSERLKAIQAQLKEADAALKAARNALPDDLRDEADPRAAMASRREQMELAWRASSAAWTRFNAARSAADKARIHAERARVPLEAAERRVEDLDRDLARSLKEREKCGGVMRHASEALDEVRGGLEREAIPVRLRELQEGDRLARELRAAMDQVEREAAATRARGDTEDAELSRLTEGTSDERARREALTEQLKALNTQITERAGEVNVADALAAIERAVAQDRAALDASTSSLSSAREAAEAATEAARTTREDAAGKLAVRDRVFGELEAALVRTGFDNLQAARASALAPDEREAADARVRAWLARRGQLEVQHTEALKALKGESISEDDWALIEDTLTRTRDEADAALEARSQAESVLVDLRSKASRHAALSERLLSLSRLQSRLETLKQMFAGNKFVEFIATDILIQIARQASVHLGRLTDRRYALSLDREGNFLVRDDHAGGMTRPVTSLSGGETFLTSLSLALALSAQVQLQGRHPIEFFFLDEGFGSLDPETLELVMSALDALKGGDHGRMIGIISHVEKVKEWLPRYLEVSPPGADGGGSRVTVREA